MMPRLPALRGYPYWARSPEPCPVVPRKRPRRLKARTDPEPAAEPQEGTERPQETQETKP